MTFDPLVPLATDSPSQFPSQAQTNWSRLQTLLGANHQFNNTAASDDGYHNVVFLTQQAPTGALAGLGREYAKSSAGDIQLFYLDSAGKDYQITPTMPIRASVNFNGSGAVGLQTIRSQYNVTSVDKTSTGVYKINFTTAMPNTNYIVQITGMLTSGIAIGCVQANATYGNSVDTTFVIINFANLAPALIDVLMGNVTIFSVT